MLDRTSDQPQKYFYPLKVTLRSFYALHAPLEFIEGLSRHHAIVWEQLLSGGDAQEARWNLVETAESAGCSPNILEGGNVEAIWMLTPAVAASLACGPGSEPVCLRGVREALEELSQRIAPMDMWSSSQARAA